MTLGPVQNPVRSLTHGAASLLCVVLAIALWRRSGVVPGVRLALVAFALTQVALFATSCLYHAVAWGPVWKARMQRADHCMIYLKIAGAVTPIFWLGLERELAVVFLGLAWLIAALGVLQKVFAPTRNPNTSVPFQFALAVLSLPAVFGFCQQFPGVPAALLWTSGTLYLAGGLVYITGWPRPWPHVFSSHEIFHLFTVGGSSAYSVLALRYLCV
jgi:hemolysin III